MTSDEQLAELRRKREASARMGLTDRVKAIEAEIERLTKEGD